MAVAPVTHLVDSVILIDHFNGIAAATAFLRANGDRLAVSVITRAEVLTGFDAEGEGLALALLRRFPTLGIDEAVADLAARMRRQKKWKMPDAFQAALAIHHGLKLATRNTRDFDPKTFPFVEVPYQL
ncbi:MAG: PIN domain-containing protein [Verrucomicrobiota bacterium]